MYHDFELIFTILVIGFLILNAIFAAIFATIDYATRGKHWGLSFGRTILTTFTFTLFVLIVSTLFGNNFL